MTILSCINRDVSIVSGSKPSEGVFGFTCGVNDGTGSSRIEMFIGNKRLDHVMTFLASETLDSNRQNEEDTRD